MCSTALIQKRIMHSFAVDHLLTNSNVTFICYAEVDSSENKEHHVVHVVYYL